MKEIYREGVCGLGFTPDQKQIVLIKRKDFGIWYLPGGNIDQDTKEVAIVREFEEETGLTFKITNYQGVYDFIAHYKIISFHDREHVFSGVIFGGEPAPTDEAKVVRLFNTTKLPWGLPYWQKEYITDAINKITHNYPVIQKPEFKGLCKLLLTNPQLVKTPVALLKKLTEN